jgi:hypothetical protein
MGEGVSVSIHVRVSSDRYSALGELDYRGYELRVSEGDRCIFVLSGSTPEEVKEKLVKALEEVRAVAERALELLKLYGVGRGGG